MFVNCRNFVSTSVVTYDACVFVGCANVDLVGAALTDCTVSDFLLAEGEPAVTTNDIADISGTNFIRTAGNDQLGHALEIDTLGTYSSIDNSFTGYGPDKASFLTSQAFTAEALNTDAAHGFVDGDAVYYGDEGGVQAIGLTDGNRYYVNQISATSLSLHVTRADAVADANRVNLTTSGAETHYLYSAHAALFNNSGGLVTVNVQGGTSPSVRNSVGSTTVVQQTVTLTVQVNDANGDPVSGARVRIENASTGAEISQGTTNASGTYTDATYNYTGDLAVTTKVRLKGFKPFRTGGTILSTGLTVGVTFQADNIVDLP